MKCPTCGCPDTYVIDARPGPDDSTRRRRKCAECDSRFTTYETIAGKQTKRELWFEIKPRLLRNLEKAIKQAIVDSFREEK